MGPLFGLFSIAAVADASIVKLYWTTTASTVPCEDKTLCGVQGPDGPWQAVLAHVGTPGNQTRVALYPAVHYSSEILGAAGGGRYNPVGSGPGPGPGPANQQHDLFGDGLQDYDAASTFIPATSRGEKFFDLLTLPALGGGPYPKANTTLSVASNWSVALHSGSSYTPKIGTLGLSPVVNKQAGNAHGAELIHQLKAVGRIPSQSFGLHIGSAGLGQSGSLILGGYEQNRALGDVAVSNINNNFARVFLVDLQLGIQVGGSPFLDASITKTQPKSVWQGPTGSAGEITKSFGGSRGSAIMTLNALSPSIYLPAGNCEAIAQHLPVIWRGDLGYYGYFIWNESDAQYERIVRSPGYLAFTFSDRSAKNVTIKLPFALLNLKLEPPIVETPMRYFPCASMGQNQTFWQLGRAFLQGAFLGLNFDSGVSFLAQAPGPDSEQSVAQEMGVNDESIQTNPISSFEKTWESHWTVLPEAGPRSEGGGRIAGIVLGSCVAVASVTASFLCWRRRGRSDDDGDDDNKHNGGDNDVVSDSEKTPTVYEVAGTEVPLELGVPSVVHELPLRQPRFSWEVT
ncbi:uncharacterized protein UV8b_05840 [Ustilaginoidea virens]|uniref:Peptidase A1 domain-containing protein n=1 Tax=Ustilaginoidea virens TaxID=1159556 RepID=A0A1B5KUG0_USTVR|nr:uncharacterized protein UV8b_05840 [Ustilaginoidea virens]QUC21597.1 hypothetical protein UV8b_05840 [Ustilaginoidea virens]GAO13567.1 hypothetical protein UVI_02015600 [Ustilaginoidea virens]